MCCCFCVYKNFNTGELISVFCFKNSTIILRYHITGIWIPPKFPYIAFNDSGYDFSHVSLFGFYRHIGALLSIRHTPLTLIFKQDPNIEEIVRRVISINDYFPFERKVTREIVYGNSLNYLSFSE